MTRWERNWMRASRLRLIRPLAYRLAALFRPGYKTYAPLARLTRQPFVSPGVVLAHPSVQLEAQCFLGSGVSVFSADGSGRVVLGERSALNEGVIIETSAGGAVEIGAETHIQPRCQLSAARGSIRIGSQVQIAPACGFYPYAHGTARGIPMRDQELTSKGDIQIEDDVWLGYGVVVLEGVTIAKGAVVAAGAVVTRDVPTNAIAAGVPARVVGERSGEDDDAG